MRHIEQTADQLCLNSLIFVTKEMANANKSHLFATGGFLVAHSGHPRGLNRIIPHSFEGQSPDPVAIAEVHRSLQGEGSDYFWFVPKEVCDLSVKETMRDKGFRFLNGSAWQGMYLKSAQSIVNTSVGIPRVPWYSVLANNSDLLEMWVSVVMSTFNHRGAATTSVHNQLKALVGRKSTHVLPYITIQDHKPIGACLLVNDGHAFGLHWVATVPNHQGRGVGRSMLTHVLRSACLAVPQPVVLHSTPQGRTLYKSLGFTPCSELEIGIGRKS